MSSKNKGNKSIKGYHAGGGVKHTHGPKKPPSSVQQGPPGGSGYSGSTSYGQTGNTGSTTPPNTSAYSSAAASGYMGAGYTPAKDRLKISQANPNYVAPGAGGTIVTTGQDNISRREKLDAQGNVVDTTFTTPPKDDKPPKEDKKEQVKYYDDELGQLSERDLFLLEKKIGQKAIIKNGKIFFVDTTGSVVPAFAMIDKLGGALDKFTGFRPEKSFGSDDPRTAATFAKMFGDMDKKEFEDFLNRKGNLDRIMDYAGGLSPTDNAKLMDLIKAGDPQALADRFMTQGKGLDADKFQSYYDKIANPEKYYSDPKNVPQTSGGLADLASLDASQFSGDFANQIFAAREELRRMGKNPFTGNAEQSGGGIGDFQTSTPTPPATDPNVPTPDFLLKRQYMPGFTPSYTGGPEQMQIAGGYYDPVTKKFIGNPYGTASQYQFAQGGIVGTSPLLFKNQGGMASNKGIKSFKNYGY